MNSQPKVSVLTPTFNRRGFIPQYLKNLRRQDYPLNHLEIIIADDGDDAIQDLVSGYPGVRYIRLNERNTIGYKRNLLVSEARGDILIHMDDDDYYPPERISHAVQRLLASDNLLAGASHNYIYDSSRDCIYESGPFDQNHGLDGTFAYFREYVDNHSFDDDKSIQTEGKFTNNFTSPMVQLDPFKTILIMQHASNTWNKGSTTKKISGLKLKNFIRDNNDRRFYRSRVSKL